jgi:translation elongation factor EF-Ts
MLHQPYTRIVPLIAGKSKTFHARTLGGKCRKDLWDVTLVRQAFISCKAEIVTSVLNDPRFKAELKYGLNSYYWEFEQWQKVKTY